MGVFGCNGGAGSSKKRIIILAISVVVLIAVVITAIAISSHGRSDKSGETPDLTSHAKLATALKGICNVTLYPDTCYDSLAPMVNSTSSLDPRTIFHLSIQIAMNELGEASKRIDKIEIKNSTDRIHVKALKNCKELIELAVVKLNETVPDDKDLSSKEVVDNLKTWLSSALTYQQTCVDGFEGAPVDLRALVGDSVINSTALASNSLAILTTVSKYLSSISLRRRLLSDEYPSWVSVSQRKLLEDAGGPLWPNVVVAKDGSGDCKTISEALQLVPNKSEDYFIIYVKEGTYHENVVIEKSMLNIVMIGDGKDETIVSGSLNVIDGTPTFSSATFAVKGDGFLVRDMGFFNTAGPSKHQAVALMSQSDKSIFFRCQFNAFQDTLYVHSDRQFYKDCDIYGSVDFIFGNAATVLQHCNIYPRRPNLGQSDVITAQGKADPNMNTGISIHNSKIWPADDLTGVDVFLGRPWKNYSTTVYMNSYLPTVIKPAGWMEWVTGVTPPNTIFYGEYQNFGPGAQTKDRVKWKGVVSEMSDTQAEKFAPNKFLQSEEWITQTGLIYIPNL